MKNQLNTQINCSEVEIQQIFTNHNLNTEENKIIRDDEFDDSKLELRPEFIEELKKLKKEEGIPIKSIHDLLDK